MKVSYEHDQDPRYGWVNVDMDDSKWGLIVVQDSDGICHGFTFENGEMTKSCICSAWSASECACVGVDWGVEHA